MEQHRRPDTDREPVHRGHDGLRKGDQRLQEPNDVAVVGDRRLGDEVHDVIARRENIARARQDDRAHLGRRAGARELVGERSVHRDGERVLLRRPIEDQRASLPPEVVSNLDVHASSLALVRQFFAARSIITVTPTPLKLTVTEWTESRNWTESTETYGAKRSAQTQLCLGKRTGNGLAALLFGAREQLPIEICCCQD